MYYKKTKKKLNNKWYPQSVTTGEPIATRQVADRLAAVSTVSRADVAAVLAELAGVMADYMALGHTVKLDGLGTFYYTATASGNGVDKAEDVTAEQIKGVRVRFIPETRYNASGTATRSLVAEHIKWQDIDTLAGNPGGGSTDTDDDPTPGGGEDPLPGA